MHLPGQLENIDNGGLSNPEQYGDISDRLSKVFRDYGVEVFEDRHHFDPPHRIEPVRLASVLKGDWNRGGGDQPHRKNRLRKAMT